MKVKSLILSTVLAFGPLCAVADEDAPLIVEGETLIARAAAPAHMEYVDEVFSGWVFRADETQALQMDDFENPAFVFVDTGLELFETVDGSEGKACAS